MRSTLLAIILLMLQGLSACQINVQGGIGVQGGVSFGSVIAVGSPSLPQSWANSHACDPPGGTYDVTKHIPGDYAATFAGINQSMTDWVAAADQWWHVIVTHGTLITGSSNFSLQAKAVGAGSPTKCIVYESDTPLTAGRTVCAHGIQDNLATSTDPGVRNPDCNGSGMTYQVQNSLTSIPTGAFTLANGTNTNTSAYNDVASMWTLECTAANCNTLVMGAVDANGNGPNHIVIRDAEVRVVSTNVAGIPVDLLSAASTVQGMPSFIGLDRIWAHGDATDSGSGNNQLSFGVAMDCKNNCWFTNSQISKNIRPGGEGHGLYTQQGATMKWVHNWIEGGSIGVFSGGVNVPANTTTGASAQDVEFRRNRSTYPQPWIGNGTGAGSVCGANVNCVRKNAFEFKGGVRILIDGNILENIDNSGSQNGVVLQLTVRACSSGVACDNYLETGSDFTITNNILRHGCQGLNIDAGSGPSAGISSAIPGRRYLAQNLLIYDLSQQGAANRCTSATGQFGVNFGASSVVWTPSSVSRTSNVVTINLTGGTGLNQTGLVAGDPITLAGCTDTTYNMGPHPFVFATTVSGDTITVPNNGADGSTTCTTFKNNAGWPNYLTINHVTSVIDFNPLLGIGSNATLSAVQFPRNITITNTIVDGSFAGASTTEGTTSENSYFDNATLLMHHTVFARRRAPSWVSQTYNLGTAAISATGSPAHRWHVVSSGASGGSNPAWCNTTKCCQTDNVAIWQEDGVSVPLFSGSPDYTEYQVLNTGIRPPTTLYFPYTNDTYAATADATSIGFKGSLSSPTSGSNSCTSGTQVNGIDSASMDLADWHNYQLDTSSSWHNAGSDSLDIGAIIPNIDAAQTSTKYTCQSACGSGPFAD